MTTSTTKPKPFPQSAPRRCFLRDVANTAENNSSKDTCRKRIRVMGMLSQIHTLETKQRGPHEHIPPSFSSSSSPVEQWVLDDGTGTLAVLAYASMRQIQTKSGRFLSIDLGMTLECLAYFETNSKTWTMDQCAIISDANAQSLRWLELCHREKKSMEEIPENEIAISTFIQDDTVWGYPCLTEASVGGMALANEIFRLLSLQQTLDESISVSDLSILFEMTEDAILEMLQELQLSGRVYQDETGKYVPLV